MSTHPVNSSLSREAYTFVRQHILHGHLKLGQIISRRKLARELGMSFLPVSEALLRLELEGLLESRPRAGTRVRIPTEQDVLGHYAVREALEVQAAHLFVENGTKEKKTSLLELARQVDAMSADAASDRTDYLTLHESLHRQIAECAHIQALSQAIDQAQALASTWLCVGGPSDHPTGRHLLLVEILSQGNAGAAEQAMREHVRSSQIAALVRLAPYFQLQLSTGATYARSAKGQQASMI